MDRIESLFESMDINLNINDSNEAEIEFWTDTAGQDVIVFFDFDGSPEDFIEKFTERAEGYDIDEEVQINISSLGKNGVPETVRELLDDCTEAKDTLMKIANRLNRIVSNKHTMTGSDLISNLIDELSRSIDHIHEYMDEHGIDTVLECETLLDDIKSDIDRYNDYSQEINTALEGIIIG